MNIHLTFLNGAANAIADALRIHDALTEQKKPIDPYLLSRAVDSVHLGADRMLKHSVAGIDPYLLLANPKTMLLRDLRRTLLHGGVTSIFTSPVHFETIGSSDVAKVLAEVTHPAVDPGDFSAFTEAFQKIIRFRNHVQHGELHGDSELILSDVKQLLGALFPVATVVCPEILHRLREIDGQAESRLKAYKQEIDGAWQVLLDHLRAGSEIRCSFRMFVALPGPNDALQVLLSSTGGLRNAIRADFETPPEEGSGLFRLFYDAEGQSSRDFRRALITALDEQHTGRSAGTDAAERLVHPASAFTSMIGLSKEPQEKQLLPLESGEFRVTAAAASLWLHLQEMKGRTSLRVNVVMKDWRFAIEKSKTEGVVEGSLLSALGSRADRAGTVQVIGGMALEGEYVLTEQDEELGLPPGTVWRVFRGELALKTGDAVSPD